MAIMDEVVTSLEEADNIMGNEDRAISLCNKVLEELSEDIPDKDAVMELLVTNGFVDFIIDYFQKNPSMSWECKRKLSQTLAEIAKNEACRLACTDEMLIEKLVSMLQESERSVLVQTARALGNICYDNDEARQMFTDGGGIKLLVSLIDQTLGSTDFSKNDEVEDDNLISVLCGCLLNSTNTNERAVEIIIELRVINLVMKILKKYLAQNEEIVVHTLLLIHCIADSDAGESLISSKEVLLQLYELLDEDTSENCLETLLELLLSILEDDAVKLTMTQLEFPDKAVQLLKKSDYSSSLTKKLLDLVTLLLTEDASMQKMFDNGNGTVYQECLTWISSKDLNRQRAGLLAIGNFARNDENCVRLVQQNVHTKLMDVAKHNLTVEGDLRIQHGCLAALRNLAIPQVNKTALLDAGLLDILISMSEIEAYPVVFKLVGTLRMLTDKQASAAIQMATKTVFMERLIKWCGVEEHPGVKGESTRLLGSLIRNSKSSSVAQSLIAFRGVPFLVNMICSEHTIMQNEALVALNLVIGLCSSVKLDELVPLIDMGKALQVFFKNSVNNQNFASEIIENAISLADIICRKDKSSWIFLLQYFQDDLKTLTTKASVPDSLKCQIMTLLM